MKTNKKKATDASAEPRVPLPFDKWIHRPATGGELDKIRGQLKFCPDPKASFDSAEAAKEILLPQIVKGLGIPDKRWTLLYCYHKKETSKKYHSLVN